jgi:hypothetical protein
VIQPEQVHLTSEAHQATQQAWILQQAAGKR